MPPIPLDSKKVLPYTSVELSAAVDWLVNDPLGNGKDFRGSCRDEPVAAMSTSRATSHLIMNFCDLPIGYLVNLCCELGIPARIYRSNRGYGGCRHELDQRFAPRCRFVLRHFLILRWARQRPAMRWMTSTTDTRTDPG